MADPPLDRAHPPQRRVTLRSYRRHRKQSRWGVASLICPGVAVFWAVFWYLRMSRNQLGRSAPLDFDAWMLYGGCLTLALLGVAMAALGKAARHTRHQAANTGLTLNLLITAFFATLLIVHLSADS